MSDEEFTDVFLNSSENKNVSNNISNNESDTESNDDSKNELLNTNIFLEDDNKNKSIEIKSENRITKPKLTKYEKVRILGERNKQLVMGAKPLVKVNDTTLTSYDITLLEYNNNMIPFKIKRPLPNGTYEVWKFSELENI